MFPSSFFTIWQLVAVMNKSYLSMFNTLDKATLVEAQLHSAMGNLKRNEELRKQIEVAKASQVEEIVKVRGEKENLEGELRDCQVRLETLANDNTILTSKVATLDARA